MIKFKIKKGDKVQVISGDDKGKVAEVLRVMPKSSQVIVAGCKIVKKSMKATEQNKNGGFVSKEAPMHISNVKKVEA